MPQPNTYTFTVGPCVLLTAPRFDTPHQDWVELGYTQGDVVITPELQTVMQSADQAGGAVDAYGAWRVSITAPLLDSSVQHIVRVYPGAMIADGTGTAAGVASRSGRLAPRAWALVPQDQYNASTAWWGSEDVIWAQGVMTQGPSRTFRKIQGQTELREGFDVGFSSILYPGLTQGLIGRIHRLGIPTLGLGLFWDASSRSAMLAGGGGTFVRSSAGYYKHPDTGIWTSAPANEARFERCADGRMGLLLETQRTNMMLGSNMTATAGWFAFDGATPTITQGMSLPQLGVPNGAATRIQTSGGTNVLKYYCAIGASSPGVVYTSSVFMQNNAATPVVVFDNLPGSDAVTLQPGEAKRVIVTGTGNGVTNINLSLSTTVVGHSIDVVMWCPQVEVGSHASSPIVGTAAATTTRAADAFSLPYTASPQALTLYAAQEELAAAAASTVAQIGVTSSPPRRDLSIETGGPINATLRAGAGGTSSSSSGLTTAAGNLIETRAAITAVGAASIEVSQGGGASVTGPLGAAVGLPAAWSAGLVGIGASPGGTTSRSMRLRSLAIVHGDATLAALRTLV